MQYENEFFRKNLSIRAIMKILTGQASSHNLNKNKSYYEFLNYKSSLFFKQINYLI